MQYHIRYQKRVCTDSKKITLLINSQLLYYLTMLSTLYTVLSGMIIETEASMTICGQCWVNKLRQTKH